MNNVTLFYGYSKRNAGDMAITLGAIDVLLRCRCRLTIVSRYSANSSEFETSKAFLERLYPGKLTIEACPFTLDRDATMLRQISNYLASFLVLVGARKRAAIRSLIGNSNLVVFNGGNLLRSESPSDWVRLLALTHPFRVAHRIGVQYIIFPQSCSNIDLPGRQIIGPLLRHAKRTFVRENESLKKLSAYFPQAKLHESLDLAFFTQNRQRMRAAYRPRKVVAFTVRGTTVGDLREMPAQNRLRISHRIVSLAAQATEAGFATKFIAQTEKDIEFTREIVDLLQTKDVTDPELLESNDPIELKQIYRDVSILIGMRLHSIILALSQGTLCYGIFFREWGLKNPGLMKNFSLDYEMLDEPTRQFDLADYVGASDRISPIVSSKVAVFQQDIEDSIHELLR